MNNDNNEEQDILNEDKTLEQLQFENAVSESELLEAQIEETESNTRLIKTRIKTTISQIVMYIAVTTAVIMYISKLQISCS